MKTHHERSLSTHHNTGEKPLYFQPRSIAVFRNGRMEFETMHCSQAYELPNDRRHTERNVRLALLGIVFLILGLWGAYRCLSADPAPPEPVQVPAVPQIEFRSTQPVRERLDPALSA